MSQQPPLHQRTPVDLRRAPQRLGSHCKSLVRLFKVATLRVGYLLWPVGLDSEQRAKKSCHSSRHCPSGLWWTSGEPSRGLAAIAGRCKSLGPPKQAVHSLCLRCQRPGAVCLRHA